MKAIRVFQCSVLCACALLFASQAVLAQDALKSGEPEKIKIGEEYFTRGEIIADFLDVAFSERMWNSDAEEIETSGFSRMIDWYQSLNVSQQTKKDSDFAKYKPWYAEFLYDPAFLPPYGVINRWDADITIGIGWPSYSLAHELEQDEKGNMPRYSYNNSPQRDRLYPIIESAIKTAIPSLEKQTGRKAVFIPQNDKRDYTADYARIRIIPVAGPTSIRTWKNIAASGSWSPLSDERLLWGAILAESSDKNMEIYTIPKPGNQLGMAVCKINENLADDFLRVLINECLVRSVGLPDTSGHASHSHLRIAHRPETWGAEIAYLSKGLTAYDRFMIKLLYCPSIKSGMDKNGVFGVLLNGSCF